MVNKFPSPKNDFFRILDAIFTYMKKAAHLGGL